MLSKKTEPRKVKHFEMKEAKNICVIELYRLLKFYDKSFLQLFSVEFSDFTLRAGG